MKKLLYILLFLGSYPSLAQNAPIIEWQKTIGGTIADVVHCLQQTIDGGYILVGNSNSYWTCDKTESSVWTDFWMVKIDLNGNIIWQNTIKATGYDFPKVVQQTVDGGFITGVSNSNAGHDKTENALGLDDFWVVKTDSLGNIQWEKTIGGNGMESLGSILQTTDGGYFLAGTSDSDISGDKTENSVYDDYWVIKLNSQGIIQWENTISGLSIADKLTSAAQTPDGGFIVGGYSSSSIGLDKTVNTYGQYDYWIIKMDGYGNIQWQKSIGGDNSEELSVVQTTNDGGYILGGFSVSNISGLKTEDCRGNWDFWIVKINSIGSIMWQKTIGGSGIDKLTSLIQTTDNGYLIGGYSDSDISGDKTEASSGGNDFWVLKLNSTGNLIWQTTLGGTKHDYLYSLSQTTDGGYILGGGSTSGVSGDKTEHNCSNYSDFWIVKIAEKFNLIEGKVYLDLNSNSVHDLNELEMSNHLIKELNTQRISFSQPNGSYKVVTPDSGNFSVIPAPILYYSSAPAQHNVNFLNLYEVDSTRNFAFQPQGMINDLCVTITPLSAFRPGFTAAYNIHYKNVGTVNMTGTVNLIPHFELTYDSSSVIPDFISLDSIIWVTPVLSPFDNGDIIVYFKVDSFAPNGTIINSPVRISPILGDTNPANNQSQWNMIVTGSFDPNDILVDRETIFTSELATPPFLEYIIRFQNTGTDTAFTVYIKNKLPINLELFSFEFMKASHDVQLTYNIEENELWFQFDNILLPDSNTNELLSHGFVHYRIKPKSTLVVGDLIENYAAIYFDFNAPVITNTAVTEIIQLFTPTITPSNLILCPNESDTLWTQVYDSYQWYKDGNIITGATEQFLIVDYFNDSGYYFKVEVDSAGFFEMSDSVLVDGLTFLPPFVIQSGDFIIGSMGEMIICPSDTAYLILGQPYDTNIIWTDNGVAIPGANNDTLMVTQAGLYHVTGSPTACPNFVQGLFDDITVIVQGPPTPVVTLTGSNLTTQSGYTYQWYLNGNPIAGSTNTIPVQGQGIYTVTITDNNGCSETSSPFIVTSIIESLQSGSVSVNYNNGMLQIGRSITNYEEEIFVLDLTGRIVANKKLAKGISQTEIQLHHIKTGIYFVKINDAAATVKFFVE